VTVWPALVECALLGTARRPVPEDGGAGELAGLLAGDDADSAERRLLRRAGVLALYRRAGALPAPAPPGGEAPAPPEPRPACSRAAAHDALQMLEDGAFAPALAEWLALAAERGLVAAAPSLPGLLDVASGRDDLVAPVVAVLGARGRWLAARRPEWHWAAADAEARWQTTGGAVRRRLLAAMRAADPGAARALLETTWDEESARDREQYIGVLAAGLGAGDEPLLERALADRAKGVRVAAARLLAALPASRFAARMADTLRPLVRCERRRLAVALPEPDSALRALGIGDGPPPGLGAGAWGLQQLVAAVPLSFWEEACGRPADRLVRLDVDDGLREAVHGGWVQAAVRQRSRPWATALLDAGDIDASLRVELFGVVERSAAEAAALALDRAGGAAFVPAVPGPWSAAFTVAVFESARDSIYAPELLRALGRRGDPAALDRLHERAEAGELDPRVARYAADALTLLDFRRRMRANLTETA
jgi:Family of unknown function (DUF5691)